MDKYLEKVWSGVNKKLAEEENLGDSREPRIRTLSCQHWGAFEDYKIPHPWEMFVSILFARKS